MEKKGREKGGTMECMEEGGGEEGWRERWKRK